ncbi:ABC transporter substrate-binding protein [Nonomuraea gerenzanensis]|uniref:Alkanesulfonates-binding protein n=1 Tax=Nonomuraea gerenzanensis TaxID=93944 RepID=A0A1M4EC02_9ACTN|nr:ABC transporter substrate-binding protein [Nonomuraea gerenzanensis]UBU18575.1 ABC transporter substrate-binding protein [Nonomuraea gerenzanensis]SBO96419.1 Alkanesulfonates-binding protein [Nonomuraea gerenzanensis]
MSQAPRLIRRPRSLLGAFLVLLLPLAACAPPAGQETGAPALAADAPLPTAVPEGTKLIVGDPPTKVALQLSGELDSFSFDIEWANLSGGPQTSEAFRADALDVGAVAEIPPIHAVWTGLPVKIVASRYRKDPLAHPTYELGIAPGVHVRSLRDLRGKKIAYSPGQAQGALVLKALKKAGLSKRDVTLVELPSTGDVYPNALASKQVDVAPIGGVNIKRYLTKFGRDGATTIPHGLRDDPAHLYVRTSTLRDPAKAAAIREYVAAWARAAQWAYEHPEEWIEGYYVKDQGLTAADGEYLVEQAGEPDLPADWSQAVQRHQETVDILAAETGNPPLKAEELYDLRYESVGADAVAGRPGAAAQGSPPGAAGSRSAVAGGLR